MIKFKLFMALLLSISALTATHSVELTTELVAQGLSDPLFVTSAPGDTERLFVLEQNTARIKIIKNGEVLPTPFLDLGPRASEAAERGLLGLAFHPKYSENGFFFVNYTDNNGDTVIARYTVSDNPDVADPESVMTIANIKQPIGNHNGGMLAFGPNDGYLYIGMGDGGGGYDPKNRAQNGLDPLGKMHRIDVDKGTPFAVPQDNPFVNDPKVLDTVWALGLRNPWRFTFDSKNGDMYIADVGQRSVEEISWQSGTSKGGENYGWRCMEGNECTGLAGCKCNSENLTKPIHQYKHKKGNCSITGGYVYRGSDIAELQGTYFFGDFCTANIWSFKWDGTEITQLQDRTEELAPRDTSKSINSITSFGPDARGELYIVDRDGDIFKIVSADRAKTEPLVSQSEFTLLPPTPGKADYYNTFNATGATPGGKVTFIWGVGGGASSADKLCRGMNLDMKEWKRLFSTKADKLGNASYSKFFRERFSGQTRLIQAIDIKTCKKSNIIENTF
jgi:glucose/arabinose dehydrogenase